MRCSPLLLTGHTGHGDQYLAAVLGLATHVTAASVWLGGLLALGIHLRSADLLTVALPRYSRMALGLLRRCCRVGSGHGLGGAERSRPTCSSTPYGRLLLGEDRRPGRARPDRSPCTVGAPCPAVAARRPRAFLALAAVELVVMAATAGLAVGLSRTAPPEGGDHAAASSARRCRRLPTNAPGGAQPLIP